MLLLEAILSLNFNNQIMKIKIEVPESFNFCDPLDWDASKSQNCSMCDKSKLEERKGEEFQQTIIVAA